MWFVHTLIYTFMIILNFIDLSLQFECLPDGAPIPGVHRGEPCTPVSDTQHTLARPQSSTTSLPNAEFPLRSRSRSRPPVNRTQLDRHPPANVLGYGLDQLEFIRLISFKNPKQRFAFRRYAFPVNESIEYLEGPHKYMPIPNQEQIVLSTFDGDVFAILDGADYLSGIYTCKTRSNSKVRAKINMRSSKITPLTTDEMRGTPVGRNRKILYGYRVENLNQNDGSLAHTDSTRDSRVRSFPRHMSLPTRLPASDETGYELDQLQFIRLISIHNSNQTFELRRYTFPADKLILFLEERHHYEPVPVQEVIVMTKDPGDVFAILESSNALAGIYSYNSHTGTKGRVKINMMSETVIPLTTFEVREVPVGRSRTISSNFKILHVNNNPLPHSTNEE